jgi:hypothetical protein
MNRINVTFVVSVSITNDGDGIWQKEIRKIRKILKDQIGSIPNAKVIKIDTREG